MRLQIPDNPSRRSQVHLATPRNKTSDEVPRLTATINKPFGVGGGGPPGDACANPIFVVFPPFERRRVGWHLPHPPCGVLGGKSAP